MSDAASESPRPPRPSRPSGERPAPASSTPPASPWTGPRRRAPRRPTPEERAAREEELARQERERRRQAFRELLRGWPAFAVSLAAHAAILVVLGLIAFRVPRESRGLTLFSSFGVDQPAPAKRPDPIEDAVLKTEPLIDNSDPAPRRPKAAETPAAAPGPAQPVIRRPQEVSVAGNLSSRGGGRKRQLLGETGGDPDKSEQAVVTALQWLKRTQKADGHWQLHAKNGRSDTDPGYPDGGTTVAKTDTGATALALLCYLGAGHTHQEGTHSKEVARGLAWLRKKQQPDGLLYDREFDGPAPFYAHAQATIALAEALAMTGDESLRPAVEQALAYIAQAQNPTTGGWKYRPRQPQSDLSVTGWQLMALQTGRMGGWEPPPVVLDGAAAFLTRVEAQDGALYKYDEEPRSKPTPAMTAEGLLCRQYLGWPADHPAMRTGVDYLLADELVPRWESGARNVYHWYYASQMLHNLQGEPWKRWQGRLTEVLVAEQEKAGAVRGSWHPFRTTGHIDEHTSEGGRLYVTCLCVLILETPYRHQPLFAAPAQPDK